MHAVTTTPNRVLLLGAFGAIYFIWGSTYLAIRIAIETIPPFLMAAARFFIAGLLVYVVTRARGAAAPTRQQWVWAVVTGGFLLGGGNGGLVWAEQFVPSGVAALVIASVPFWMVLLDWLMGERKAPSRRTLSGLMLGFAGVAVLSLAGRSDVGGSLPWFPVLVLLGSSLAWSIGSLITRHSNLPRSPFLATGMQMIGGSLVLGLFSWLGERPDRVAWGSVSLRSLGGFAYLVVLGSIVAFSAYVWLLRVSTPAKVSMYAMVNPSVAVFFGWWLAGEPVNAAVLISSGLIIAAVALVTFRSRGLQRVQGDRSRDAQLEPRSEIAQDVG